MRALSQIDWTWMGPLCESFGLRRPTLRTLAGSGSRTSVQSSVVTMKTYEMILYVFAERVCEL
eukprot:6174707-Pleurochrysis_carterae.AAC.3